MLDVLVYLVLFLGATAFLLMVAGYKFRDIGDSILYHPDNPPGAASRCESPAAYGIKNFEMLSITTKDGVIIRGFGMYPPSGKSKTTLVYFHGNAGNVGHRLPLARVFLNSMGCNVVMMDYRMYGLSDKLKPTEEGLQADGQAVLDYVNAWQGQDPKDIILMGTSLGGAVTTYIASRPYNEGKYGAVILENTFTSIGDMVDALFGPLILDRMPSANKCLIPFLSNCIKPLVLFIGWVSKRRVHAIKTPLLFLAGAKDEIVPHAQMQLLHERATGSCFKRWINFPEGTHNDLPTLPGYFDAIKHFAGEYKQRTATGTRLGSSDEVV